MSKDKVKEALESLKKNNGNVDFKETLEKLGVENVSSEQMGKINELAEKFKTEYAGKSEDEIVEEISKMKDKVDMDEVKKALAKNRKTIKTLYDMMDDKQKKSVEKMLNMLKDS